MVSEADQELLVLINRQCLLFLTTTAATRLNGSIWNWNV